MELLGSILNFFESTMQTPTVYGWFHILFVLLVAVATVLICVKYKNCDEKTLRRMIFVLWLVMVVLEIYKQLVYTFSFEDGVMSSDYQWYAFPFQLCSTPIFALPFVIFLKDGPVREAFISYSALFAFFLLFYARHTLLSIAHSKIIYQKVFLCKDSFAKFFEPCAMTCHHCVKISEKSDMAKLYLIKQIRKTPKTFTFRTSGMLFFLQGIDFFCGLW